MVRVPIDTSTSGSAPGASDGDTANPTGFVKEARESYQAEYKKAMAGALTGVEKNVLPHVMAARDYGKAAGMDKTTIQAGEKDIWNNYYHMGMFLHQDKLRTLGDSTPPHSFNLAWYRSSIARLAGVADEQLQEDVEALEDSLSEGNLNQLEISAEAFLEDSAVTFHKGVDTLAWGAAYLRSLM